MNMCWFFFPEDVCEFGSRGRALCRPLRQRNCPNLLGHQTLSGLRRTMDSCLVRKMSQNCEKFWLPFSKTQVYILKCLVLSKKTPKTFKMNRLLEKYVNLKIWNQDVCEFGSRVRLCVVCFDYIIVQTLQVSKCRSCKCWLIVDWSEKCQKTVKSVDWFSKAQWKTINTISLLWNI